MVMPPLRPVAVAPPLPSPCASGRIRGRRLETHPHAKPREAPIAAWAEQFKSSGLTVKQMREAVKYRKAAAQRKAGTAERPATKRRAAVVLPDEFVKAVQRW